MSQERLFSARNPWFTAGVGITVVVAIFSAFVGFVWLPSVQPDASFQGIWNIICGAAGVPRTWLKSEPLAHSAIVTSSVVVTPQMLGGVDADAIGRGATLALKCTMCHGARGLSEAESPNLAGQPAAMVHKELQYYKRGARMNAVMAPMALGLSDHDMSDLAAYYAYLPRPAPFRSVSEPVAPAVVANGAPMRNIPPCAACHGGMEIKTGSPRLKGESAVYLEAQLKAFTSGIRHDDISQQMRNIARQMTPAEIDSAARYYSGQP